MLKYALVNATERDLHGRETVLPIAFTTHCFEGQWGLGRYVQRKLREQGFYPALPDSEIKPFFRHGAIFRHVDAPDARYRVRFFQVGFSYDENSPEGGYATDTYVIVERLV